MKNVLITGGAGFIGSHLVDRLLAENAWKVAVLDDFNNSYSPVLKYHNIARHTDNPNFSLFGGDIISEKVLRGIFSDRKYDFIVHLADKSGVNPSIENPHSFEQTNIHGTLNLLEAARKYKVKSFIFGSTAAVYGNKPALPLKEQMQTDKPVSPYAATKAVGEMFCHTYSHLYDVRCVCLRFFSVYGARQRPGTAIYEFTRSIESGNPVTIYGDGTAQRDYVHISDVVAGIREALDYKNSGFEIINLGAGKSFKCYEIVRLLEKALERRAIIERVSHQAGEVTDTLADIKKAGEFLDFHPKIPIEAGIKNFVEWYKKERLEGENDFPVEESVEIFKKK